MGAIFGFLIALIQLIGKLLFQFWGWVPVVAVLAYLVWRNRRQAKWLSTLEYEILHVEPSPNTKNPVQSAEQMLIGLHSIYKPKKQHLKAGSIQEHFSLEICASEGRVDFYVWFPKHLHKIVLDQLEQHVQDATITKADPEYLKLTSNLHARGWELTVANDSVLPIKSYSEEESNPLSNIIEVLSNPRNEGSLAIQYLIKPTGNDWQQHGQKLINKIRSSDLPQKWSGHYLDLPGHIAHWLYSTLWPKQSSSISGIKTPLSDLQKHQIAELQRKMRTPGYLVNIRSCYVGDARGVASLEALSTAFKQYTSDTNQFRVRQILEGEDALRYYRARYFSSKSMLMGSNEIAGLYNLPATAKPPKRIPQTKHQTNLKGLPVPQNYPESQISLIGSANLNGQVTKFGITRNDRDRHVYVVGQTGTGKSYLLELLALSDIHHGFGMGLVDVHGYFAEHILQYIPKARIEDVVYLEPNLMGGLLKGINPLASIAKHEHAQATTNIVEAIKLLFPKGWNQQMEYILRYCILALIEQPGAHLSDIPRILLDESYRQKVIIGLTDPVVKNYWVGEFAHWQNHFHATAITPLANTIGEFTQNEGVAQLLSAHSQIDFKQILEQNKILVINLSDRVLGSVYAGALGALIVSQLQMAASSVVRKQPYYLYLDDFHTYATNGLIELISFGRNAKLNLTLTNQYAAQMGDELRGAIFGNVANVLSFRVGPDDARYMENYFAPTFNSNDLINLHHRHFIISMNTDGLHLAPFMASTLSLPPSPHNYDKDIFYNNNSKIADNNNEVVTSTTPNNPTPVTKVLNKSSQSRKSIEAQQSIKLRKSKKPGKNPKSK